MPRHTCKPGSKQQSKRAVPKVSAATLAKKLRQFKFDTSKYIRLTPISQIIKYGKTVAEKPNIRPISEAPMDGTEILVAVSYRYQPYKPEKARQMKAKGRWQMMGEFGWENAPSPEYWLAVSPLQTK